MALLIKNNGPYLVSVTGYKADPEETEVIIPDGVTQICEDVFLNCNNIESITLPESIRLIESRAFKGCVNLSKVSFIGTPKLDQVSKDAFDECPKLVIDSSFIAIGSTLFKYIGNDEIVTVPNHFKRIASNAFDESIGYYIERSDYREYASRLKEVKIKKVILPESIVEIENRAFWKCTALELINIPSKIQTINEFTFYGCESLVSISLPFGIKSIKCAAFKGCKKLSSITIPEGLQELDISVFEGCENLRNIDLPLSLEIYGQGAIPGENFKSVVGQNVTKIVQCYWQSDIEPFYVFPKIKINRSIKPYFCMLLSLGYCLSSDRYSAEVAKTYDRYIQKNGSKIIEFAEKRGIEGIEAFCIEHGYLMAANSEYVDEQKIVLNGSKYCNDEIDFNGFPECYDTDDLPSNKHLIQFVNHNFYIYTLDGVKNAACLGKTSMAMCILLLDGVLKSREFQDTKKSEMFGGWFSLLFEGYGIRDARDRDLTPFFGDILESFVKYGIIFKVPLPDESDTIYVIRDYKKYLSDSHEYTLPDGLLSKTKRLISGWKKQLLSWEEEFL